MRHLPALLLLLAACSGAKAPRPSGIDSAGLADEAPRFAMASPRADTMACLSIEPGGQAACLGIKSKVDTILVPAPVAARGVPFFGYECSGPTLRPYYTACVRAAGAWTTNDLAGVRALGGKLMLNQGGYAKFQKNPPADKTYDPAKYKHWMDSSLTPVAASWAPYIADGTLLGVQFIDDIGTGTWGTKITQGQQDTMAMWWKQLAPGITTFTREKATGLTGYPWKYLDASITSYNGRYMGDIVKWRDSNYVAAKTAKLGLMLGINYLNGGKLVPGCYHGDDQAACAMTPSELRDWGAVQASTPEVCGILTWKLSAQYQEQPGIDAALKTLGVLAANMPTYSCRRRPT